MRALLVALLFAAAAMAAILPPPSITSTSDIVPKVTICASANALLRNLKYKVTPNNIIPGQNVTVTLSGDLSQEVTAANAIIEAKFDGLPVYHHTLNACTLKKGVCPFPAGPFHYEIDHKVPKVPIHGTVELTATLDSEPSGAQITCVKVSATI